MAEFELLSMFSGVGAASSIMQLVTLCIELGLAALVIGVFAYIFWPLYSWPYIIRYYGYRNGTLKFLGGGCGRIEKVMGFDRLRLWKLLQFKKEYIEPVPNEYKIVHSKKKDLILLFEDNGGNKRPMQIAIDPNDPKDRHIFLPNDKDVDFWAAQELDRAYQAYQKKNPLLEWMPAIASASFLVFIFIFMLVLNKQLGELVRQMGILVSALTAAFPK